MWPVIQARARSSEGNRAAGIIVSIKIAQRRQSAPIGAAHFGRHDVGSVTKLRSPHLVADLRWPEGADRARPVSEKPNMTPFGKIETK
jgi:hypothetical protein